MVTESCTTTMRPHTLHILCGCFWPNMAPLSCSSRHTHQIWHRMTFSYSQGLRKFWKDTDLRQWRTSNEIRRRHYYTSWKRSSQNVSNSGRNVGRSVWLWRGTVLKTIRFKTPLALSTSCSVVSPDTFWTNHIYIFNRRLHEDCSYVWGIVIVCCLWRVFSGTSMGYCYSVLFVKGV